MSSSLVPCPRGVHCLSGASSHRSGSQQLKKCSQKPLSSSPSHTDVPSDFSSSTTTEDSLTDIVDGLIDSLEKDVNSPLSDADVHIARTLSDAFYDSGVISDDERRSASVYSYATPGAREDAIEVFDNALSRTEDKKFRVPKSNETWTDRKGIDPLYLYKVNHKVNTVMKDIPFWRLSLIVQDGYREGLSNEHDVIDIIRDSGADKKLGFTTYSRGEKCWVKNSYGDRMDFRYEILNDYDEYYLGAFHGEVVDTHSGERLSHAWQSNIGFSDPEGRMEESVRRLLQWVHAGIDPRYVS